MCYVWISNGVKRCPRLRVAFDYRHEKPLRPYASKSPSQTQILETYVVDGSKIYLTVLRIHIGVCCFAKNLIPALEKEAPLPV